jgi:hypothetical protein
MPARLGLALVTLASIALSPGAAVAQTRPYTEGSVWFLTMIRTTPGFEDDYLRSLASTWKRISDEGKKEGIIVSYKILSGNAVGPDDWDLLLMVELKNWAAIDGITDKFEAIQKRVVGGEEAQRQLATKRLEIRRILGSKNAQELFLK